MEIKRNSFPNRNFFTGKIGAGPGNRLPQPFNGSDSQKERIRVINYLQNIEVEGMRKHLCFSCAFVTLYDKNNKAYKISRFDTLLKVQGIVETIKSINNE